MTPVRVVRRALRLILRGYQLAISPLLGPNCRFEPRCSQYAIDAIEFHGAGKGAWLALKRVLRCHPFHAGGWDPIPRGDHRGP